MGMGNPRCCRLCAKIVDYDGPPEGQPMRVADLDLKCERCLEWEKTLQETSTPNPEPWPIY